MRFIIYNLLADLYSRTDKDDKALEIIIQIEKETTNNGS